MGSSSGQSNGSYDLSFKILLIGDSGVGKSSLLVSFISASAEDLAPTIGVDFKIKLLTVGGKRLKLTIWDTEVPKGSYLDSERAVSREEGNTLAKELGCMFLECSSKTRENVEQCFKELALKLNFS
ncbi:hypothetical protein V6N11_045687 [Hibiscus sabdariffa]|uniref:Uncharacterized protein n=1 Tax=Hibiscus sabdariffa TaxID=183260 RepID=A0ABR2Q2A3_9ROSI